MKLLDFFLKTLSVSTDSRQIQVGDIYFALKGNNFDGNEYALQALEKGASLAVVDNQEVAQKDKRCYFVNDVLFALQNLASEYRSLFDVPVLAITGSNGKTTTKELIASVISKKFNPLVTIGNLNNHIGVPLTLLNARKINDFFIIEMGANHQGEIDDLCKITRPNFGVITNIGKAHLEGFGGIEGVMKGKSELYKSLEFTQGIVFVNTDDQILSSLYSKTQNIESFSVSSNFSIISLEPTLVLKWQDNTIETNLFGDYNVSNIAYAVKIGQYFGVSRNDIIDAISHYKPKNNRSEVQIIGTNKIILDAYNSNPSSLRASISSFFKVGELNQKIVIIGDMLELGDRSYLEHQYILEWLESFNIQLKVFIGAIFYEFRDQFTGSFYKTVSDAKNQFNINKVKDSEIFLKGSRGIAVEKIFSMSEE